jgi:hypothetical protein
MTLSNNHMKMKQISNRGGRRPGSGRKKSTVKRRQLTLHVMPEALARLGPKPAMKIREFVENLV